MSIESEAEWIFLKNTILKLTLAGEYFIGLRKDGRPGEWGWLSNRSISKTFPLPWAKEEPTGDGECANMYRSYRQDYGKYNDVHCTTQAKSSGYICEFPIDSCNKEGKLVLYIPYILQNDGFHHFLNKRRN